MKARLNNVCMQLRKNCNHPDLLFAHFEDDSTSSSCPSLPTSAENECLFSFSDRIMLLHL